MKKKQRKKNNKKKTKDTYTVSQTPTLLTTMTLSSASAEPLGGKLESLHQSTPSQSRVKEDLCKEEDLCKGINDLAFSGPGRVAAALCKGIDDLAFSGPGNHLNKDD